MIPRKFIFPTVGALGGGLIGAGRNPDNRTKGFLVGASMGTGAGLLGNKIKGAMIQNRINIAGRNYAANYKNAKRYNTAADEYLRASYGTPNYLRIERLKILDTEDIKRGLSANRNAIKSMNQAKKEFRLPRSGVSRQDFRQSRMGRLHTRLEELVRKRQQNQNAN